MLNSRKLLDNAGILPKLRLGIKQQKGGVKSTGPHRVKVLEDKIVKKADADSGGKVEYVRYFVEENGEKKVYDARLKDKVSGELHYFVQRFAELNEGDEVILEMKKMGAKNYIQITPVDQSIPVEIEEDTDEPIVEDVPPEAELSSDDIPY